MEETFRLLGEAADVRVGIRREGQESGIEVMVRLHRPGPGFQVGVAREMLDRLEALSGSGYDLTAQDGWWVVCEKAVTEHELAAEGSFALRLVADLLGDS